jgi:hypothetical protein
MASAVTNHVQTILVYNSRFPATEPRQRTERVCLLLDLKSNSELSEKQSCVSQRSSGMSLLYILAKKSAVGPLPYCKTRAESEGNNRPGPPLVNETFSVETGRISCSGARADGQRMAHETSCSRQSQTRLAGPCLTCAI